MRIVQANQIGSVSNYSLAYAEMPDLKPGHVMVRVAACGTRLDGTTGTWDPSSAVHSRSLAFSAEWKQDLGENWKVSNVAGYSNNKSDWAVGALITAAPLTDLFTFFLTGTIGIPGTTTFRRPDGSIAATVVSASGFDFNVTTNNLPNQNILANGVQTLLTQAPSYRSEGFQDTFTLSGNLGNHNLAAGVYFQHGRLKQRMEQAAALLTLEPNPQFLSSTLTTPFAPGATFQITGPDGLSNYGLTGGGYNGTQQTVSLFAGDSWEVTDKLTIEGGVRYEHIEYDITNLKQTNPATGFGLTGPDGNPLTLFDNAIGTPAPSLRTKRDFNFVNFTGALVYDFSNQFTAYARFTSGKKAPSFGIIQSIDTPEEISALFPSPQKIQQLEFGFKYNAPGVSIQIFPFYSKLSNVADGQVFFDNNNQAYSPPPVFGNIRMGYSLLGTTNHPAPAEATGLEVDKFDGAAVERYLDHYLGMYSDTVGPELMGERGLRALLTDSIEVGAANWTPRMIARFQQLRGYDPRPWLPALAGFVVRSREDSDKFLYDYRRTLADLMASEHYATIAKIAHAKGLKVYGEALEDHRPSLGDDMEMRRYADVPMSAMWTYPINGKPVASHVADMKGAASVAHLYGKPLVAAESLTSALRYWADGPQALKHVIDLEFVTGINRPIIHTSVHSPDEAGEPGLSLLIFGQFFNRHDSWAELAKPWVDYISRNSFLLQQGRNQADVAYFFGEEGPLTALYGDEPVADAPTRYAYDFINPGALTDAISNDGNDLVSSGGARYRVIYLGGSSSRMTLAVLKRLAALAEGGATIVGPAPVASPTLADDRQQWAGLVHKLWSGASITKVGSGQVIASRDIEGALESIGVTPDFQFTGGGAGADIPFLHRKLQNGDSYFLVNRKDRAEKIEARFRVTGKVPELWSAETGKVSATSYRIEGNETIIPLEMTAGQSIHVVFRKPALRQSATIPAQTLHIEQSLDQPWTVSFASKGEAPASISMDKLIPLNEHSEAGVKYFSGVASYTTSFSFSGSKGQQLLLELGEVHEVAEVLLNGRSVGYVWQAPYVLELDSRLLQRNNVLEVRVANLWVNRMIGDAQAGAGAVSKTTLPTYDASAPLRRSGLIGPVRIMRRSN